MKHQGPPELPPSAIFMQALFGKIVTAALGGMARTGAADHMSLEPDSPPAIAARAGVNADALSRVLRLLASVGIFTQTEDGRYALNPVSALLQRSHPESMRDVAIMMTDPWTMNAYSRFDHSLATGGDAVTAVYGKHAFDVFHDDPAQGENFARAMTGFTTTLIPAVMEVADFSPFRKMADVGGSHGVVLSKILAANPALHGVLFDLPEVIRNAPAAGQFAAFPDRITYESGSFFERVPEGCDAYIMKHIVHDWDDERCRTILSLMRDQLAAHAPDHGRVFLIEMVVPPVPDPVPAKFLDIEMLVCTVGGRERSPAEFAALFASAGLQLAGIKQTQSPVCLIEASLA